MLSVPHLIIIFVVVLVFFGPEKLPELARNLGRIMAEFRRATGDLRMTFEEHMRDLERETEQRRIGGPPPVVPVQGTVVTSSPKKSANDTPATALPVATSETSEPAPSSNSSNFYDQQHEPEPNPEIESDGRNRPA
jgi:TatA/E family protein of Tat protein translocase